MSRSIVIAAVLVCGGVLFAFLPGVSAAIEFCEIEYAELKDMSTQELTQQYCSFRRVANLSREQSKEAGSPEERLRRINIAIQCSAKKESARRLLEQRSVKDLDSQCVSIDAAWAATVAERKLKLKRQLDSR